MPSSSCVRGRGRAPIGASDGGMRALRCYAWGAFVLIVCCFDFRFFGAFGDGTVEICVKNDRSEDLRAYWDGKSFDIARAFQRSCWTVFPTKHYKITTEQDEELAKLSLTPAMIGNIQQEIHVKACLTESPKCGGHGFCTAAGVCECHDSAYLGHWTGPSCKDCKKHYVPPYCRDYCNPNGIVEAGEQCDDGNTIDNDGCSQCTWDEPVDNEYTFIHIWFFAFCALGLIFWVALSGRGQKGYRADL